MEIRDIKDSDENQGCIIVLNACKSQLKKISENSGISGEVAYDKVMENYNFNFGFNARAHQYGDLVEMDLIDPTKFVKSVICNDSSFASVLLTTEVVMIDDFETNKEVTIQVAASSGY